MIKPTIGRVVWFWNEANAANHPDPQPFAAIVAYVLSNEEVNLAVFDRSGDSRPEVMVKLWQGEGERPKGRYCEWMPYQKGQAAKVEAGLDSTGLEKRIAALEALVNGARAAAHVSIDKQVEKFNSLPSAPPPIITSLNNKIGEDPNKDGTGIA